MLACIGTFLGNPFHQSTNSITESTVIAPANSRHHTSPNQIPHATAIKPIIGIIQNTASTRRAVPLIPSLPVNNQDSFVNPSNFITSETAITPIMWPIP